MLVCVAIAGCEDDFIEKIALMMDDVVDDADAFCVFCLTCVDRGTIIPSPYTNGMLARCKRWSYANGNANAFGGKMPKYVS